MGKSEVYSWRLSAATKSALERAAKRADRSIGGLLEQIVEEWMNAATRLSRVEEEEQLRLHRAASRCLGVLSGGEPRRAERARQAIRARLANRHARRRPH